MTALQHDLPPIPELLKSVPHEDDGEEAVTRLLRSSSARFAANPALDYASLPPLPHPINDVISNPAASTTTLGSVSQRSTYTVTITSRTLHSLTEFPNAYPPRETFMTPKRPTNDSGRRRSKSVPITPRDEKRLLRLRQDPSVASLLNVYDEHGCLDSKVFSNTPPSPPREGRVQARRRRSTLRQLLGHTRSQEFKGSAEGDISWAEQFLGESEDSSPPSSPGLETPKDILFNDHHFNHVQHNTTFPITCDTSENMNHPTISSLEVELSISTEATAHVNSPYETPMTPQRASQVFDFLIEKRKKSDIQLPTLPSPNNSPPSRFSSDSDSQTSDVRSASDTYPAPPPVLDQPNIASLHTDNHTLVQNYLTIDYSEPIARQGMGMSVSTTSTNHINRGPRGPRPPSNIPVKTPKIHVSRAAHENWEPAANPIRVRQRRTFVEMSNSNKQTTAAPQLKNEDTFTAVSSVSSSHHPTSSISVVLRNDQNKTVTHGSVVPVAATERGKARSPTSTPPCNKENNTKVRDSQIPRTPVRPPGFKGVMEPPSPASSSELSPVTQQLMANLRTQRMQARHRERQTGRLGSSQSRIRY